MDATIAQVARSIEYWWRRFDHLWDEDNDARPSTEEKDSVWSQVNELWQRAPNWHTMTELNRRYLQRRLPVCASYSQPLDIETDDFTNLLHLHDYGIISTNSCPGWETSFERQRAYLYFSIPTQNLATAFLNTTPPHAALNFVRNLLDSQEVYAYIRFQYGNAPAGVERNQQFRGLMPYGHCTSLPEDGSNIWADEEWDLDLDENQDLCSFFFPNQQTFEVAKGAWTVTGHYEIETRGSALDDDDNHFAASEAADPLQITVIARDWNYREIGELIERLLIRSGIAPGFMAEC